MEKTYIYRYDTKDGTFIGYHYDSFCTVGNSIIEAKRYPMSEESIPEQTKTIRENMVYLANKYREGLFHKHPVDDVILSAEELAESIEQQYPHTMRAAQIELVNRKIEVKPLS